MQVKVYDVIGPVDDTEYDVIMVMLQFMHEYVAQYKCIIHGLQYDIGDEYDVVYVLVMGVTN